MKYAAQRSLVLVLLALTLEPSSSRAQEKDVVAPVADILSGRVRLPDPCAVATRSRAWIVPLDSVSTAEGWSARADMAVGARGPLALAIVGPGADYWTWRVRAPGAAAFAEISAASFMGVRRRGQDLEGASDGSRVERIDLEDVRAGSWSVEFARPTETTAPSAWFVVRDALQFELQAWVSTLATTSDRELAILARLVPSSADAETDSAGEFAAGNTGRVRSRTAPSVDILGARGRVVLDRGRGSEILELHDDGAHQDGAASDGLFGALLPPWTTGDVRARIELSATSHEGFEFQRALVLAFSVLERAVMFAGEATSRVVDDASLALEFGALLIAPAQKLHVSAEVWGIDAHGELVPVCWLSRMQVPETRDGRPVLSLRLDGRWLDVAGARPPLVARHLRVQDPDTHVPYDLVEELAISVSALPPIVGRGRAEITPEMLMGSCVGASSSGTVSSASSSSLVTGAGPHTRIGPVPFPRALMLVHGYCSSGQPWPANDFTAPKIVFTDANANRTHDQFALLIRAAGGMGSFGVVAHSQGGPAALHLYTYYTSGLDAASGPRLIQSLASPYQGTPLASLGAFACGVNNDMTPSGAATWLAGIPTWARDKVSFWTTADAGSACNFLTGLLLANPEDGTVERFRCDLPGAHSMGHVSGWCHTTGMTYPANYTDAARNAELNTQAAR